MLAIRRQFIKPNVIFSKNNFMSTIVKSTSIKFNKDNLINANNIDDKYKVTNFNKINQNEKLKKYIGDVYKYSGYGFAGSLGASLGVSAISAGILTAMPTATIPLGIFWFGNVCYSFYSLFQIGKYNSETTKTLDEVIPEKKLTNYKLFCISNGITIAPLVGLSFAINPVIVPLALSSTIGTFAGASYFALKQDNLNAITWQAPLMGCVTGLIGSGLVQIGASLAGYTTFAHQLDIITTLVSTGVFTGLIVADTQQAIQDFENKTLDSIKCSVNLLLDATNLFIDFIKIFTELTKNLKE